MMDLLTGPTNLLGVEKYCTVKSLGKICLLDIFFFVILSGKQFSFVNKLKRLVWRG